MAQNVGRPLDISVRLPADLAAMLDEEASATFLTKAEVIRQALRPYLNARRQQRLAEAAQSEPTSYTYEGAQ